jgi:hypothetical protein
VRARLVVLIAATVLLFGACSGDGAGRGEGRTKLAKPGPTATTATGATGADNPDSTDSTAHVGALVTGRATELIAPAEPETRQIDAEAGCRTFLSQPSGDCAIVAMAGGNALWTNEAISGRVGDERVWRLRIWTRASVVPDGGWQVALELPRRASPTQPRTFAAVGVHAADVTGDGAPELLIGYRAGGTGQLESYDVVTYRTGAPPRVGAHREQLHKGSVTVDGARVVDYSADAGTAECCPTSTTKTTIEFRDRAFRITDVVELPIDQQPPDVFA